MYIKAIIVDDEIKARNSLAKLLSKYCEDVSVITSVDNVNDAEYAIRKHKPEIVFLDVEMPEDNGFELLKRFKQPTFEVIFTTAHPRFAQQAFRYSAIDFLQKPIDFRLLVESLDRFKEKTENKFQKERYEMLLRNMHFDASNFNKLAIPTVKGFTFINIADIVYVKANRMYSEVYLLNGDVLLASKPLRYIGDLLSESIFYRCHKSYIVNLNMCTELIRSEDYLIMVNHAKIPLSSNSKSKLLTILNHRR